MMKNMMLVAVTIVLTVLATYKVGVEPLQAQLDRLEFSQRVRQIEDAMEAYTEFQQDVATKLARHEQGFIGAANKIHGLEARVAELTEAKASASKKRR